MAKYVKISVLKHTDSRAPYPVLEEYKDLDLETRVQKMLGYLEGQINQVLPDKPDLIVLPENCDRYTAMNAEQKRAYYKYRGDRMLDFYKKIAKENHCYIAYSATRYLPGEEKLPYRNSTQIIGRDGEVVGIYDKNFLTIPERENAHIAFGDEAPVFELDFGRVGCAICFDLNYMELMERYAAQKPDLLIFSSVFHGGFLQKVWAYNCRSYFAGAITGDTSAILSPLGEPIASAFNYASYVTGTINLDYAVVHWDFNDEKLAAARQKYGPLLQIYDPGHLGSIMLTYEGTDRTMKDIVNEFELELLDDYFARCRAHRNKHLEEDFL